MLSSRERSERQQPAPCRCPPLPQCRSSRPSPRNPSRWAATIVALRCPPVRTHARTRANNDDEYHQRAPRYVWKLVYIHMLGYDVDFGHMEIISLLTSTKYTEKLVGYVTARGEP